MTHLVRLSRSILAKITRSSTMDRLVRVLVACALVISVVNVPMALPNTLSSPITPPIQQAFTSPLATPAPQTVGGATPLAADSSSDPDPGWKLLYNPPVPDLFSGAATFNYPIEVPPGRKGLQPQVNLVYSSRSIDGLLDTGAIDAGPIALGWSLNFMDIVREGVNEGGDGAHKVMNFPNQFSLLIDGTSHELQPDTSNANFGRYHVRDLPGYYVERRNDNGGGGAPNDGHEYWFVRLPDGTAARLGYTTNSELSIHDWVSCDPGAYCGVQGDPYQTAANRWRVDVMTDTFGNTMTFNYTEATKNTPDGSNPNKRLYWFQQSRPAEIDYNAIPGGWGSRVVFLPVGADQTIHGIQVYNAGALIRQYQLNQEWKWDDQCNSTGVYTVKSIVISDSVGPAADDL